VSSSSTRTAADWASGYESGNRKRARAANPTVVRLSGQKRLVWCLISLAPYEITEINALEVFDGRKPTRA
jgi:hypothetical protein